MLELLNNPLFVGMAIFSFFFLLIVAASYRRELQEERRKREIMERNYYSKANECRELKRLYNHEEA